MITQKEENRAKATEYLRKLACAIEVDYIFNNEEIDYIKRNLDAIFEFIKES